MKTSRQEKILELITDYEISTQEELTMLLNSLGYKTTQATVSRDIKALQLQKISVGNGQKYAAASVRPADADKEKYLRIFRDGLVKLDQAANLVVIKTISGMAMAVAAALDELHFSEIVGSIAGDDTIMCACRSDQDAELVISRISSMTESIS